jgi:response regulator RpfG family c-di-GMP phosphodiesterase
MNGDIGIKKTILVVDDVAMSLTAIRSILRDYYEVCISKSAKAALMVLERVRIDLILLDLEMPEVSGFEFLKQIQENPDWMKIPVICVTAHSKPSDINEAVVRGVRGYLVKPINAQVLLKKIQQMFEEQDMEADIQTLMKRLSALEDFCLIGNSDRAENLVKSLKSTSYTTKISIRLESIDQSISMLEYDGAVEEIHILMEQINADSIAKSRPTPAPPSSF